MSNEKPTAKVPPLSEEPIQINVHAVSGADEKIVYDQDPESPQSRKNSSEEDQYDFTSEEFASIPELVRDVVSFEDDPKLPVITFRSVLLSAVFCIAGSVVSQLS
jgi:hypothetical protein